MKPRISLITLSVVDMTASRAFYQRLGWRESSISTAEVTFFQAGGMVLSLYRRADQARDMQIAEAAGGFAGIVLAHNVATRAEVDAILADAVTAGAKVLRPPHETFWGGYVGYFADPDGHPWEIAWNPGFALSADGALTVPP
ncbi:MAG: VOC family protein [Alphaproteobacteria bacterium]